MQPGIGWAGQWIPTEQAWRLELIMLLEDLRVLHAIIDRDRRGAGEDLAEVWRHLEIAQSTWHR